MYSGASENEKTASIASRTILRREYFDVTDPVLGS